MKYIIRLFARAVITFSLLIQASYAQVGCMARTTHGDTQHGYDYKKLHFVACTCDCARHKHLARRCKCEKCGHYIKHLYRESF